MRSSSSPAASCPSSGAGWLTTVSAGAVISVQRKSLQLMTAMSYGILYPYCLKQDIAPMVIASFANSTAVISRRSMIVSATVRPYS